MTQNRSIAEPQNPWLYGALAGLAATAPMTVFMLATQRFLPRRQRYALPPEVITSVLSKRAHVRWHMSKEQILGATLVSHFAYGAAMGTAYGPLEKRLPLPAALKGVIFGLLIWAASYLGLLPMLGMPIAAQKEPMRRNLLMIGAHVIWGSSMGIVTDLLENTRGRS